MRSQQFHLPDLRLERGRAYCDIASLGGEQHRAAFAAVFARFLHDNRNELAGLVVTKVSSQRPVVGVADRLPLPLRILMADSEAVAYQLYDSLNDSVVLELADPSGQPQTLAIDFDNPEFRLS